MSPIKLHQTIVFGGRTWHLYAIDFETADGPFCTYLYALSHEHAQMVVQEMRETATLRGQITGIVT